jgi:hypothetical protein
LSTRLKADLLERFDFALERGADAERSMRSYNSGYGKYVSAGPAHTFRTAGFAAIEAFAGRDSQHFADFNHQTTKSPDFDENDYFNAKGILTTLRAQIARGWLLNASQIISGEMFADLLDMAQHLVGEHYSLAAAVLAGSSLEAHMRRLATAASIDLEQVNGKGDIVPKKADTLNAELKKANVYDAAEQKQITAWLAVRNNAAHGHQDKIHEPVVAGMVDGIRNFIVRHP